MGAVTVAVDADGRSPIDNSNAGYMVRAKITMSNSYTTGGDTISATLFGFGRLTKLNLSGAGGVGGSGQPTAYLGAPVYDSSGTNVTAVQAFGDSGGAAGSAFAEVTAATNLSTVVFDCIAFGT